MTRDDRVAQIYGYAVCLVAVVTVLASVSNVVESLVDRSAPLSANRGFPGSLDSFEAYKATSFDRPAAVGAGEAAAAKPDSILHREYEAMRSAHVSSVRQQATRTLVSRSILIAIAAALFAGHWRWLQRARIPSS